MFLNRRLINQPQSLFELFDVMVNQMLLPELFFINQANKRQIFVDMLEIKANILRHRRVMQFDRSGTFLVELRCAAGLFLPVNASHIDQHINQLRANLVIAHLHHALVRCDVDFRGDVEEERLVDT